jgi:ATP/maltotriose-dependent transcriptional regulator MalT
LASSATHFALVLDNILVISAQPVLEALTFILEHPPQPMHLVLLTRAEKHCQINN